MKIELKFKLADRARRPDSTGPRWSLAGLTTGLLFALAALAGWRSGDPPTVVDQPPIAVTQPFTG